MPLTQRQHRRSQNHSRPSRVVSGCACISLLLLAAAALAESQKIDNRDNSPLVPALDSSLAVNQHTGQHATDFSPPQHRPSRLHYSAVYLPITQQRTNDTQDIAARPQRAAKSTDKLPTEVITEQAAQEGKTHSGGAALAAVLRNSLQQWWRNYTNGRSPHWLTAAPKTAKQEESSGDTAEWDYSLKLSDDKVGVKFEKPL